MIKVSFPEVLDRMLFNHIAILTGLTVAIAVDGSTVFYDRATGGYVQAASGNSSFTNYNGCAKPGACQSTSFNLDNDCS